MIRHGWFETSISDSWLHPVFHSRLFAFLAGPLNCSGLVGADDAVIWSTAAKQGFVLVTKDDDFLEISILRGAPPKVVVIGLGNCRTSAVAALLSAEKLKLEQFERDPDASLLELTQLNAQKPNSERSDSP